MFNADFYPTPRGLASRMVWKLKTSPHRILEPSAGKGDLVTALKDRFDSRGHGNALELAVIESDPTLQATLRGQKLRLIDSDFLAYSGQDKFDAIVMNPPFSAGDKHLLKAIEVLYRGEIVCLLNAETLKNPYTSTRQLLLRKIEELGGEVEYHQGAFEAAERKSSVEVALVYIRIERQVEDDLFFGCDDHAARSYDQVEEKHEVSTGRTIEELVLDYNERVRIGTEVVLTYYRHHRKIGQYLGLNGEANRYEFNTKDLTGKMQASINEMLMAIRNDFWRRTLSVDEVQKRLTAKKREEFNEAMGQQAFMDFTELNIRQFVLNLIGSYEQTMIDAVLDIFDLFTQRHAYEGGAYEKNIHYFNGWKTNKAFKVGKRVIFPIRASYGNPFVSYGRLQLDYQARNRINDIDLVVSYLDGMEKCTTLVDAIESAFKAGEKSGESTHFKFICYLKGTLHLTFKNMDILRRFNVVACRGKGWLPNAYGTKGYGQMTGVEKMVVDAFEGERVYSQNLNRPLFAPGQKLQLTG